MSRVSGVQADMPPITSHKFQVLFTDVSDIIQTWLHYLWRADSTTKQSTEKYNINHDLLQLNSWINIFYLENQEQRKMFIFYLETGQPLAV